MSMALITKFQDNETFVTRGSRVTNVALRSEILKKIFFFSTQNDMITEAKRLGLKGYSRLRKLDLLELIKGSSNKVRSILNQTFPDIDAPVNSCQQDMSNRRVKEMRR